MVHKYTGELHPLIDHPMQEGWTEAGLDILGGPEIGRLEAAYTSRENGGNVYDAQKLATLRNALASSSRSVDAYRYSHERANMALLALGGAALDPYYDLAGRVEALPAYIDWVGQAGLAAFDAIDTIDRQADESRKAHAELMFGGSERAKNKKIALELGGKRQASDYNAPAQLDNAMRQLGESLKTDYPNYTFQTRETEEQKMLQYKIEVYEFPFAFATLRRRRTAADITGEGARLELFKESSFMFVWSELTPEQRSSVLEPYEPQGETPEEKRKDMLSFRALRLGRVVEDELRLKKEHDARIQQEEFRSPYVSRKVLPLDAHYVLLQRKPAKEYEQPIDNLGTM